MRYFRPFHFYHFYCAFLYFLSLRTDFVFNLLLYLSNYVYRDGVIFDLLFGTLKRTLISYLLGVLCPFTFFWLEDLRPRSPELTFNHVSLWAY